MGYSEIEVKTGMCGKCGGSGHIPMYKNTQGGTCFRCNGTGEPRFDAYENIKNDYIIREEGSSLKLSDYKLNDSSNYIYNFPDTRIDIKDE
jgi:hypothetical protein